MKNRIAIACATLVFTTAFLSACGRNESITEPQTPESLSDRSLVAGSAVRAATVAAVEPRITSVSGISDGVGVTAGRWNGQPSYAPRTASNRFVGGLVVEEYPYSPVTANPYLVTINGSGFGGTAGKVTVAGLSGGSPSITASIATWKDNSISIRLVAPLGFEFAKVRLSVTTASGRTTSRDDAATGIVYSRGAGQCTYEVALQRLLAGLAIPPSAYPSSRQTISASYVPRKYDVLFVGTSHTAIITSTPQLAVKGAVSTWTFDVTERNARWDENRTVTASTFAVTGGKAITKSIVTVMNASFNSFWR